MSTTKFAGPIDYVVVTLPKDAPLGEGLQRLVEQADSHAISVLDLEIVGTRADGSFGPLQLDAITVGDGFDVEVLEGVRTDIIEDDDIEALAEELREGEVAVAIVYEDRSIAPVVEAWARVGGTELWAGGAIVDDIEHSLEDDESEDD